MNTKWYVGTLLIILAFIGLNQEQTKVANQQIVLQFTDVELTSETAQDNALTTITKKLEALGIADIAIIENGDAQLSIRYYSDIDANSVGKLLSQDSGLLVDSKTLDQLPDDFPKDELPETCSLIVSDLQQQSDNGLGLNGKLAFELNQDSNHFSNPVVIHFDDYLGLKHTLVEKIAYKINSAIALAIDNISHNIPEVRAGPRI